MARAVPGYARQQVNAAARAYVDGTAHGADLDNALEVINNWRSSHSFPINTFAVTLKKKGRSIDPNCLVAQRIKRLASIAHKMERFPRLPLSQMQDIGGCRAVFTTAQNVRDAVSLYTVNSDLRHVLVRTDDYVTEPQPSGYRGVHLIFRYFSDRNSVYNDLKIEMQLRSQLQHAWATAVETVGTFQRQALKSSLGEADWLRFFALMGTAIAFQEGTSAVPGTPNDPAKLIEELRAFNIKLDLVNRLRAYNQAMQILEGERNAAYYILQLDPNAGTITVSGFTKRQLPQAQARYLEVERSLTNSPGSDAVLVSVDSIAALQRAYPNYFLDMSGFVSLVEEALDGQALLI